MVLDLVVGEWRIPWSCRVYRGKDTPSPAQLGLRWVAALPKGLRRAFKILVLADTAFGRVEFLQRIRPLKLHAIAGVRYDRQLEDGRHLFKLHQPGQPVRLAGLKFPVTIAGFYLKRDGESKRSQRYVLSTRPLKACTIVGWGRHRWQIEGFFKTAKHRFGLHRFGQQTRLEMYRGLVLSLVAFLLAHWGDLAMDTSALPDWAVAAKVVFEAVLPAVAIALVFRQLERQQPLLQRHGYQVQIVRCKI
ncbi:MAG: transposase [Synechococcales cyanobacterium T60_A2020_003]|nr:transposase [Synechococcales cyanobacterium T60_A2020_003]